MTCAGCKKPITDTRYSGEYKGKSYCKACNKKLASNLVNKLATLKKK
jgi:predicted amidophosphoribosyltransferase